MNKVVEQIVKENPFIKSVITHKTNYPNKYIFDCDTTIQCLWNIYGVDTLVPYSYIPWYYLVKDYLFLDGSPCGILIEE